MSLLKYSQFLILYLALISYGLSDEEIKEIIPGKVVESVPLWFQGHMYQGYLCTRKEHLDETLKLS